ncbi:uncharacterized protein AMSG_11793 [Thecamonas trahens ATCC 50062]|uniref:N-acetyltransferase domain-containing protein n=1 Tax=Thecamonas trahens ATCC 50062 TaxID=461836 RepID=A0A0L0D9D0_THETB|nr:hypothetical protein AMSG_11793 [Thecamonas trahens ATCC 50062]KNC47908.1 hypothetical protein AMSG_11793 [Thecamonas trahens ATCC 50062]|eukprot:XP_013759111.1 hypothetical protein AMSG_11793 [Thecamonas trahens ATCC 50062]
MDEGLGAAGLRLEVLEGSLACDDVLEAVALLLNSFWRRSLTARLASLRKSGRDLAPTSFVLVDDRSEMIVGHARVWWAARKPAGASGLAGLASLVADGSEVYVESVIIAPSLRGLGVGKALMAGVEQAVAEMFPSVTTWWLNTKDQALFYASIGFVETFDSVEHGSSVVVAADGETAAIHEAEAEAEHEPSRSSGKKNWRQKAAELCGDDDAPVFAATEPGRGRKGKGKGNGKGDASLGKSKGEGSAVAESVQAKARAEAERNKGRRANNNGSGRKRRKKVYKTHLSPAEVDAGLADGSLTIGEFRVNAHNPTEGYATSKDYDQDVFVDGMTPRNRAFHGDTVALRVKPESQWKSFAAAEPGSRNDGREPQPTGSVVAILDDSRRPATLIGMFKPSRRDGRVTPDDRAVLFQPLDKKQPRLLVPIASKQARKVLPNDFLENFDEYTGTMFQVNFDSWSEDSRYGYGRVVAKLGKLGSVANEERAILLANSVKDEPFTGRVLRELDAFAAEVEAAAASDAPDGSSASSPAAGLGAGSTRWPIPAEELAKRRDFRGHRVVSIDPLTARDLDDALSVEVIDDEHVEIGVHIADVTYFVREGTPLDDEAAERSTSVYLVSRVIPMLPRMLCEQLCSLQPGVERLTFSAVFKMNLKTGAVVDRWFGRSVIKSCAQMAYEHAQMLIDGDELPVPEDGGPVLFNGVSAADVAADVLVLRDLSRKLRARRFASGALSLHNPKLAFKLNEDMTEPIGWHIYEIRESNKLIEEFMLLANREVAKFIHSAFPETALLRLHPPPQERKMTEVIDTLAAAGYTIDASSSGSLHASLQRIGEGTTQRDRDVYAVVMDLLASPMQSAQYFCTADHDENEFRHYALAFDHYTHFTSPIRRYPDCVVHRLLAAALGENQPGLAPARDAKAVTAIADHANEKKYNAKQASTASGLSYLCVFLANQPIRNMRTLVSGVGSSSFTLLAPGLSHDDRVYIADLAIHPDATTYDEDEKVLTLHWRDGGVSRIAMFEPVMVDVVVNTRRMPHVPALSRARRSTLAPLPPRSLPPSLTISTPPSRTTTLPPPTPALTRL